MPQDPLLLFEEGFHSRIRSEADPPFYMIAHTCVPAGTRESASPGPFYEISVVLSPAVCRIASRTLHLHPSDILFLGPDTSRAFAFGQEEGHVVTVRFLPAPASPMESDFNTLLDLLLRSGPVFRLPPEVLRPLFSSLNGIHEACTDTAPLRDLSVHMHLTRFLLTLLDASGRNTYTDEAKEGPSFKKMHDVAAYIRSHYAEPLTLGSLAARFYISGFYLSHQFRAVIGMPLSDFIRLTRIRNVQLLLLTTSVPVTEAAMRCGFTSFSQFNRSFREVAGMPPSRYRRLYASGALPPEPGPG